MIAMRGAIGSVLAALLACTALQLAAARPVAQPQANSVLEYLHTRQDTLVHSFLLGKFPYLHQLLADPGWTGTVFVPVDKAYVKGLKYQGVTTVAGALAQYAAWFEPATNPDFTNRQFYDVKCNWRGLNTKIVPNKRLEARDLKNGSYFTTPLDCCDGYNTSTLVIGREKGNIVVGNDYFSGPEGEPYFFANVTASVAVGKNAVVHLLDSDVYGACDDDGSVEFAEAFLPGRPRTAEAGPIDYPLVTGPWSEFMQPQLTLLGPSDEAWAAFFASNKAKGAMPTSVEEMLADKDLTRRIIDAHLIGGQQLFQWDFLNLGMLGKGKAQVSTLAGQAYNVTFVQDRATAFHGARLVHPTTGKQVKVMTMREPGGEVWATVYSERPGFEGSKESAVALKVDAVLFP